MYKHTQVGWYILFFAMPVVLILAFASSVTSTAYLLITVAVLAAALIMFCTLTVFADNVEVGFYCGPGIIRKKFLYSDIESVTQVRNHWLLGWGIRWFGRGWLYNVSGLDAIELKLKSGKLVRIGTDEPERLMAFLQANMG